MAKTVVGLFDRWADAQAAVQDIEAAGVRDRQVSIIGNRGEASTSPDAATDTGEATLEGAGTGAASGAMIGTGVGLLAGLGALAIPGFGPIIAAGPIMAALTGAGVGAMTGAVAGGLVGALSSVGVPETEAGYYEEGVRRGGTLVVVECDDYSASAVADAMQRRGVVDIEQRSKDYRTTRSEDLSLPEVVETDPVVGTERIVGTDRGVTDEFVEGFPAPRKERLVGQGMEGYAGEAAIQPPLDSPQRELAGVASEEREPRTDRPSNVPRDPIMTDDSSLLEMEERTQ